MSSHDARSATPRMPGSGDALPRRPVDLSHLSRQTMGDRELEREVLQLFVRQAEAVRARILEAESGERLSLAHSLKGSALNVGAFAIAQCAAGIESHPADRLALRRLALLIDEVRDFVAAISR
jgi:HPt (histidine-containing phosphotransfer) domain-containing protein